MDDQREAGSMPVSVPANTDLFFGGDWHKPAEGGRIKVVSPSTGAQIAEVAAGSAADLDLAVAAATRAQGHWRRTAPLERARKMRAAAERVRAHKAELAALDALDCGNPLKGMEFDVELGATLMEFFAGLATEIKGETVPVGAARLNYVQRVPLGVVARIVPFNHPVMFLCAKMAAPIIAGNAVIMKPSEHTPLSALRVAELVSDLFPKGLFNVLNGDGTLGAAMAGHPGIANVSVVGSVQTGRAVMREGAATLKRVTLELGGKNALVIYPDADIERAVEGAVKGMNLGWTAGQSCGATSRVFAHDDVYDEVVSRLADAFEAVTPGDPLDPETEMGSLSTRAQYDKTLSYIALAKDEGASLAAGAAALPAGLEQGLFVRPTLFADVRHDMRIAREEVFGPVLSVLRWSDHAHMVEQVNGVEYGLTASIWTRDLETAFRAVDSIDAGYVWINNSSDHFLGAPFGGVKQSGIGREECLEELLGYTEQKNVSVTLGT